MRATTLVFAAACTAAACGGSTADVGGDHDPTDDRETNAPVDETGSEAEPEERTDEPEVAIPEGRARDEGGFLAQTLDLLRRGDADGWIALLMTREEYETRCEELVRNNSEGWLDEEMARRAEANAMRRCQRVRSAAPLRILDRRGGGPSPRIRMPECVGYQAQDPFRLIVESADGERHSVRIDAYLDQRSGAYIPSGYVECHRALPAGYACARLAELTDHSYRYGCEQALAPYDGGEVDEVTIRCIEAAADADAAGACWDARMRAEAE